MKGKGKKTTLKKRKITTSMSTLLKLNFQHYIENMVEIKKKKDGKYKNWQT